MEPWFCSVVPCRRWIAGLALLASGAFAGELRLSLPPDGGVTANNAPSLAWRATAADRVEVWLDGRQAATLPGSASRYVPFPLSFGSHRWNIVAIRDGRREKSGEATFTVADRPLAALPDGTLLLRDNWRVISSETAGADGAKLSVPGVDTKDWAATSIPATVLTALVRNGVYPNPYVGLNNTRIPDANDVFNERYGLLKYSHLPGRNPWKRPYWYRTAFRTPADFSGRRVWLGFNEINYRAEIWLNGRRVAGHDSVAGMERAFRFDVTRLLARDGENCLAVAIYPLDDPGEPAPPPVTPLGDPGRNMGADTKISTNYSKWDTIGWDWQPEVRDRDIGITEEVFLYATGDLEIERIYAGSELALPGLDRADVRIAFDIVNRSGADRQGTARVTVRDEAGKAVECEQPFSVPAGVSQRIEFTPASHPALALSHPRVWWPVGLGPHPLYTVEALARSGSGESVEARTHFGVRKIETSIYPASQTRFFRVNGRPLFMQGGNWVIDMMLNWTASRYDQEVALACQARLNYLRIWGPTGVPPEEFFDAADREGMLLQVDFLNDWWGTEHNMPGCTPPEDIFEPASRSIIEKCRNHPSVFAWCGGNEGPNPHETLLRDRLLPALDPWGSRYYLPSSNGDGLQGGGPYDNLAPEKYFNNPKLAGFNSEIGPSGIPEFESLEQFLSLPPTNWAEGRFPLDGEWAYHDATDRPGQWEARKFSHLDDVLRHRYGSPAGTNLDAVREYAARCQMLNHETYRAAIESLNRNLWTKTTGFALWKFNSSWPSLVWQLDDWYLQCHAGFYAVRRACEPVHVQFNADDRTLAVVNRTGESAEKLVLDAELFDSSLKPLWDRRETLASPSCSAVATSWAVPDLAGITFLKLRLADEQGRAVSENVYWLSPSNDFSALAGLTGARVSAKLQTNPAPGEAAAVTLTNTGSAPALLVRAQLVDRESRVEILPALWSDNDFVLMPGESRRLTVRLPAGEIPAHPAVVVSGYNLPAAVSE